MATGGVLGTALGEALGMAPGAELGNALGAVPVAAPGAAGGAAGAGGGGPAQPTPTTKIAATNHRTERHRMWVILLEIALALGLLVFIVWWTMFSGRRRGERVDED
jgi:hypothetical protein